MDDKGDRTLRSFFYYPVYIFLDTKINKKFLPKRNKVKNKHICTL